MLFNSAEFIFLYLPVVLTIFYLLAAWANQSFALLWLVIASLAFYSFDNPTRLLPIILCSIIFNTE